jgi:hypothetical protein
VPWAELYGVELDEFNADALTALGDGIVVQGDFLHHDTAARIAELGGGFDLALINPPFNNLDWARHILATLPLVKPDRWFACIYPEQPLLNRGSDPLVKQVRNALGLHCAHRQSLPAKLSGFPVDCEIAYCRTNSQAEGLALRQPTSEGYPSQYCENIMIALGCDEKFCLQPLVSQLKRLNYWIDKLWQRHTSSAWLWDEQVEAQVTAELKAWERDEDYLAK